MSCINPCMSARSRSSSKKLTDLAELEKRRIEAGRLFSRGFSQAEVARRLGVSRQSASRWHAMWKEHGHKGLKSSGPRGRRFRLTPGQKPPLKCALIRGPQAHGWKTDLWTLPWIACLIRRKFGVRYSPGHVWRIVRELGFTAQKPARPARERDEAAVERWLRQRGPAIKKNSGA